MKHLLIVGGWLTGSVLTLFVSFYTLNILTTTRTLPFGPTTNIAQEASQHLLSPNEGGSAVKGINTAVKTADARPIIVDNYLRRYSSPMEGYGTFITAKADELASLHHLNPTYLTFLIVAIGQNESNLGKKMPPDCHNMWGWGIHKGGTLCFDSWEEGISTVMTGIATDYMVGQGLKTPQEIMSRYTPHSPNGAWAQSVSTFLEQLETANF